MKIELELPEWTDERNIYIMAGIELAAYKNRGGKWLVKTERCNQCGKCCMNLRLEHPFPVIDGRCAHLEKEPGKAPKYRCALGLQRPFGCCVGTFQGSDAWKLILEYTEDFEEL